MCACVRVSLPAFPAALNEGQVQRLVLGDGLDNVPLRGHVAYGPLAHSRAAQTKDVAG